MAELLEIGFVDVESSSIEPLMVSMLSQLTKQDREAIRGLIAAHEGEPVYLPCRDTTVGGFTIPDMALCILGRSGEYIVEFVWDMYSVPEKDWSRMIAAVHSASIAAAEKYSISKYSCGLEPYDDKNTQVFVGRKRGPYMSEY